MIIVDRGNRTEYRCSSMGVWPLGISDESAWVGKDHMYKGHVEKFISKNVVYITLM